jgi:hypothetical protein
VLRGGAWQDNSGQFISANRYGDGDPTREIDGIGFRVASVPEPSIYALLLMTGAGVLWMARRRR